MYERMLNKQAVPSIKEMTECCGENAELFTLLNEWLCNEYTTEQKAVVQYFCGKQFFYSYDEVIRQAIRIGIWRFAGIYAKPNRQQISLWRRRLDSLSSYMQRAFR